MCNKIVIFGNIVSCCVDDRVGLALPVGSRLQPRQMWPARMGTLCRVTGVTGCSFDAGVIKCTC